MKKILILLISSASLIASTSCSYVMDSIEGRITNRSSFAVDVQKSGSNIILNWSKDGPSIDSEAFAGYEVYVTDEPNNEFAGYDILYSGFTSNQGSAGYNTSLANKATQSVTIPYTAAVGDTYFFRVGVIYWDEEEEADRASKWTIAKGYAYDWNGSSSTITNYFYPIKTKLEKISSGTMVKF